MPLARQHRTIVMEMSESRIKAFKKTAIFQPEMAVQNDYTRTLASNLDDTYLLKEFRAFGAKMIPRLQTQGIDAKFGDTEDCLSYREIVHIATIGYENTSRTQEAYTTHLDECNVCDVLLQKSIQYNKDHAKEQTSE